MFPYVGISIEFIVMGTDGECGRRFVGKLNPHCYSLDIFTPFNISGYKQCIGFLMKISV